MVSGIGFNSPINPNDSNDTPPPKKTQGPLKGITVPPQPITEKAPILSLAQLGDKIDSSTTENSSKQLRQIANRTFNNNIDPSILEQTISLLPEKQEDLPPHFTEIDINLISKAKEASRAQLKPLSNIRDGRYRYKEVLQELNRLKGRLGGSPTFVKGEPIIDESDNQKTFFGVPLTAVKDWFRMTLHNGWVPKIFWKSAAALFNVYETNNFSDYEDIHIRIQRFGMLIENKERIFQILDANESRYYQDMNKITGLAWHPQSNSIFTEKEYIQLIDTFFTKYFEAAKAGGDEQLLKFFKSFQISVCFEARARDIEEYIGKNPLNDPKENILIDVPDWDTGASVKKAYIEELTALGRELGRAPTPSAFMKRVEGKNIFKMEFTEANGKEIPSLGSCHLFILEQIIDNYTIEPYTYTDFLKIELEIFKESNKERTKDNFREHLQSRVNEIQQIDPERKLLVYEQGYPEDGGTDPIEFSLDSDITSNFIDQAVKQDFLT